MRHQKIRLLFSFGSALWLLLFCWAGTARAQQDVPVSVRSGMPALDPQIQSEIDKLLGVTEDKIKEGIVDPGIDYATLAVNKALDEVIKGIAQAVVLAPAAEKILSAYQKTKDKKLVKRLAELRQVWKDGQERLNKLNYQDFKLRYEWVKNNNEETGALSSSGVKTAAVQAGKDIYTDQVGAIDAIYDNYGPTQKIALKYLNHAGNDKVYENLIVINGILGDTKQMKLRKDFAEAKGKTVFTSPYQRLKMQQTNLAEARKKSADLVAYKRMLAQQNEMYRKQEAREAYLRGMSTRYKNHSPMADQ